MGLIGFELSTPENKNYFLRIKKVGQEFCSPNKKAENNVRNYYSIHFVIYGSGFLKIGNEQTKHSLSEGTAFLLYAGDNYEYFPDKRNPWSYIWIDLYGDDLEEFFKQAGFSREKPFVKIRSMKDLLPNLKSLHQTYCKEAFSDISSFAYFLMIYDYLVKNNINYASREVNEILRARQLREMLTYINNNYNLPLSVGSLSEVFYISERTLMRMFKEEIGMSPMDYLINFRISTACEMFSRNDSYSITEVATAVGYTDVKHFLHTFKQKKGVTPTQYINNHVDDHPFDWLKERNIDVR